MNAPVGIRPYTIRLAGIADQDALARLQCRLWSPDPAMNRAHYDWKYARGAAAIVHVAECDGKIVAMRGMRAASWEAAGVAAPATIYCADDFIVDAEHENRGLFARLADAQLAALAARGERYLLSMSALRVTRLQSLAAGWKTATAIQPLGRVRRDRRLELRLRERMSKLPFVWRLADRYPGRAPAARAFARLDAAGIEQAPRAAAMAELIARRAYDGRIRLRRDAAYLEWRFASPLAEFRFLYEGSEGYLVVQRYRSAYANPVRVSIVDCEASTADVAAKLVDRLIEIARPAEIGTWRGMFAPEVLAAFEARGFAPIDAHLTARGLPAVLVRAVGTASDWSLGARSLVQAADWDLRMTDSSLV